MLVFTSLDSEDYSGWADYAAFYTAANASVAPTVFADYYGGVTASDYTDLDGAKTFGGNPSLRMSYRITPNHAHGWTSFAYDFGPPLVRQYRGVYIRDRFELASTFTPSDAGARGGLHVADIQVRGENGGTYDDQIAIVINGDDVRLQRYQQETDTVETHVIDGSANWRGSPKQVVLLVTPVTDTATVRARVYFGAASDAFEELALIWDQVFSVSSSMNGTTNRPTGTPSNIYRWDWWFDRPASDDFRMWSYTTEFGWVDEYDGYAAIAIVEDVKARTSREVPLLNEVYQHDFGTFTTIDDFYDAPGWLFTVGYFNGLFDATRPYSGGLNAMRYRLRNSIFTNASVTTGGFSGAYANTTSWYVRQVFEWASTFNPMMTLNGDLAGVWMSVMPITVDLSTFDRSYIILNEGELQHVWQRNSPSSTTVTVLGDLADWVGAPMQLVHWLERVTATTWRIRVWGGPGSVGYRSLELLYDEVVTSSFTDAVMYNTSRWQSLEGTEYPASDDWTLWVYTVDAGIPDYFSDPASSFTDLLNEAITMTHSSTTQSLASAILSQALQVTSAHALSFTANAAAQEQIQLPNVFGVKSTYMGTLQEQTALREQQRTAASTAIIDTVEMLLTFAPARAVLMSEAMSMLSVLGANARYSMSVLQLMQVRDTLLRAVGAGASEVMSLMDAATDRAGYRSTVTDGMALADAEAYTLVLHLTVPDALAMEDTITLRQLLAAMVAEQVQLLGSMVIPGASILTWAVNTRTGATSEYTGYDFNSFARRGTRYLAAAEDGLYELNGDLDHGAPIVAELVSGFLQFAGTRFASFEAIYLGMRGNGNVFFRLTTGDDKTYTYRVTAQSMENTKIRVGKGLRARYFAFEMTTVGQDFDLDSIEFLPISAQRRV